ncbi:peptidylprolyl isomerase [Luteimonas viscosa]|uniref:Periplasmic chaperone PpiD n=1 Tax=Luteimonas viscosa TaxID=1132694 RepID=A0A5D4XLI6_9GAMM|nr:SurA N-terminal domain-containing protein [Luteimonas viscosa]TYT25429.1 peptidylprolyl isomerase [Luteimonas viscosa]
MLQTLREKMTGWIAIVVVALLAIPFAFFGMEQYLFQSGSNFAAKVEVQPSWWRSAPDWWLVRKFAWESVEVTPEEFRDAFEVERQRRREAEGEQFDARAFETPDTKREVLEALVDRKVLQLAAKRDGMVVGDTRVREAIEGIAAFQVDGVFDQQRYLLTLQSQGYTPQGFQEMVRDDLQASLLAGQVARSAFTTPGETERMMRLLGERRDVSFVVLPAPEPDSGAVGASEIQAWYDANRADYRAPERVTLEYVEIDGNALPPVPAPDEAALRQRYEQEKARFVEPEQRLVSHILVPVEEGADAAAQEAAEAKARQIAQQARQPDADFAALAKANPGDPGSAANGGDLGWIRQDGSMVEPFEDAVFAAQAGSISDPVRSPFGWHVIQLREIRAGQQVSFDEVRETLAQEQAQADRERALNDLVGSFVDEVYRNPTELTAAAKQAGLEVRTAGPIARGEGEGVIAVPAVQRAAFSDSLVQDGTVSDPIEVGEDRSVLIRVTRHEPERALTVNEARASVVAAIRADRARKRVEAEADALVEKLRSGESLQALADAASLQRQNMLGIPRGAPVPDAAAAEAYFRAPVPAEGKVSPGKAVLPDGRVVVFTVEKVTPGDAAEAAEEERDMFRQQMAALVGREDADTLLRALRGQMKITVVESNL